MRYLEIIVPVYNEEDSIEEFYRRLENVLKSINTDEWKISVTFVNDGSTDETSVRLSSIVRPGKGLDFTILKLSRNFGHQQAVWAGIENSPRESSVLVIDSDLQDPPELIPSFLEAFNSADIVVAQRTSRDDSALKRLFATFFYRIMTNLSSGAVKANVGDFWAISGRAKAALLSHREELKFLRGLVIGLGFPISFIQYDRDARYAGKTHYSVFKMIQLAIAGLTGFSIKPLIFTVYIAISMSVLLFPAAVFLGWSRVNGQAAISPGLTYVGIVTIISISLLFVVLAVLALYIARIAIEVKRRPVYILDEQIKLKGE